MVPRENKNNAYAKCGRQTKSIMVFSELAYWLTSSRNGVGTSLQIMGLATIDPHGQKVLNKLYKIHKFSVNRPNNKRDTAT